LVGIAAKLRDPDPHGGHGGLASAAPACRSVARSYTKIRCA